MSQQEPVSPEVTSLREPRPLGFIGTSVESEKSREEEAYGFVFQTESANSNLLHPGLQPSTFCSPVLGEDTGTWQG